MLTRKSVPPKGILHLRSNEPMMGLERFEASPTLRPFVEHYWSVTWEHQPRTLRETVPHPSVHLVVEPGESKVHGIHLKRFSRWIEGSGRVLGVKFRPSGFRSFCHQDVRILTNRIVCPDTLFGTAFRQLEEEVVQLSSAESAFLRIDTFLESLQPQATPEMEVADRIVQAIATDPTLTRIESVAERFGMGIRKLQRLFLSYIGVSPKWVVQRFRLIEAAERLRCANASCDFASLALELGYSDQSHLIRDFKIMVGMTPAKYSESLRQGI